MNEGDTDLFSPLELEPDIDNMDESIREIEKLEKRMEEYHQRIQYIEDEIQFLKIDNRHHGDVESKIFEIICKITTIVSAALIVLIIFTIANTIAK